MAETNPLFESDTDVLLRRPFSATVALGPHPGADRVLEHARQKMRLVTELAGGSNSVITMRDEPEMMVFGIEPAYPTTKDVLKAVYIPDAERVAYLAVEDMSSWLSAYHDAWKLTTSQATAFSNTEALRDRSGPDLLRHLSRYLGSIFRPSYGPALADRIEALAAMVREESDGAESLSDQSLESFIAFLERSGKLVQPRVVAGPSGEIVAIWRGGIYEEFTARFMPNGTVRYLLSKANTRHPQGVSRSSGDTTPDRLFDDARLDDLQWISNR